MMLAFEWFAMYFHISGELDEQIPVAIELAKIAAKSAIIWVGILMIESKSIENQSNCK